MDKRSFFKSTLILITSALLVNCASNPVIDTKGVNIEEYQQDLAECKQITEQLESGKNIAKSTAFGALVRGAFGAIIDPKNAVTHAAVGATEGAAVGSLKNDNEKGQIVKKCLINRGYNVLN